MPDPRTGSVIVFRFHGGLRDGQSLRSDEPEDAKEAHALWELTWSGKIGHRFDVAAPNAPTIHRYQVSSKYKSGDEIHVTCAHVGNR